MRIVVDIQAVQNDSRDRGIGRHTRDFVNALVNADGSHELILLSNSQLDAPRQEILVGLPGKGLRKRHMNFASLANSCEEALENDGRAQLAQLLYEKMLADLSPDVVLVASTIEGYLDDTVIHGGHFARSYGLGSIFYDLIPLSDVDLYLPDERVRAWFENRLAALRRCDFLLTNSETSREEAIALLGFPADRVHSPGSAVDPRIFAAGVAPQPEMLRTRFGIVGDYVMHAGAFEPRKNFEGLLREFALLPKVVRTGRQLVFVCNPPEPARGYLHKHARELGLDADQLIVTGFVSDSELAALYASATVFAFPSLREGFGLPPLEAMACGTATIASANSSLPEVIGRRDALFDPHAPGDLARLLEKVLTDEGFRHALEDHARERSQLFDWDRSAQAALAALASEAKLARRTASALAALSIDAVLDRIADLHATGAVSPADIALAVTALAENERTAQLHLGHAAHGGVQSWRIEGPFDSSYSLSLVNRNLARSLERLGHQVTLVSTDGNGDFAPDSDFLDANPDLDRMVRSSWEIPTDTLSIQSRNLFPPRVSDMIGTSADGPLRTLHCYAWEETGFPYRSVAEFNASLDLIFATSEHVKKILIDNGVHVPIHVCGLGTDHLETLDPDPDYRIAAKPFRFLHVSTGLARKGVDILLDAYGDAFRAGDPVSLVLKTSRNEGNLIETLLAERRGQDPEFPDVLLLLDDLTSAELKSLHQQCQVAVYPSRAEGFGLPIAEAMVCGLPVIVTGWSGQVDFCPISDSWLVDFTFEPARSRLRLAGSVWAEPDRAMLADRLREAFACENGRRQAMAMRAKANILHDQNWQLVAACQAAHVRNHGIERARGNRIGGPGAPSSPRIAWLSTWDENCGIATYSHQLLRHFGLSVTILAPEREGGHEPFHPHVVEPAWRRPHPKGGLSMLAGRVDRRRFDTIVIQFSFAFYDLQELAALVADATRDGVAVVMELHATALPAAEGGEQILSEMRSMLQRCARVLVHSVGDLNRLKAIGLVDNVSLLPHGLPAGAPVTVPGTMGGHHTRKTADLPLIISFGFALPHKGLVELVEAAAHLRDAGRPVQLLLLNAEFPVPASKATIAQIKERIAELSLADTIQCDFTFRREADVAQALAAADLIIFPYQGTDESVSGAVRHALASGRPVAVTAAPIFAELAGLVHVLPAKTPEGIATGIADALAAAGSDEARLQLEAAADFVAQLGFDRIAARIEGMCTALARETPALVRVYPASGPALRPPATKISGQSVTVTAADTLRGPGAALAAGCYDITVEGAAPRSCPLPQITAELAGKPCSLRNEGTDRVDRAVDDRFTWSALIEITPRAGAFDIVIRPENAIEVRIDRISIRPTGLPA